MTNVYTIYSKPGCPFCDKAKALLTLKNLPFEERVLDVGQPPKEGLTLHNLTEFKLANPTVKTLPHILLGDQVVGGYTELAKSLG